MQLASLITGFKKKYLLYFLAIFLFLLAIYFITWILRLNHFIEQGLSEKKLLQPINYYSAPERIFVGQKLTTLELHQILTGLEIKNQPAGSALHSGEFQALSFDQCKSFLPEAEDFEQCIHIYLPATPVNKESQIVVVFLNEKVQYIFSLHRDEYQSVHSTELVPQLFAQYYNNEAILIEKIDLGDSPPYCLNSLLAVEDSNFLDHSGFSIKSILRAVIKNLKEGRRAQGGSTITQQLVKNYFLTHEKTFKRKFKELFMAILLESKANKDDILQSYINEIYMGQNGVFQIRGFAAAAKYYYKKPLQDLNLPECALLAAIVNSPGRYNPFRNPENALARRKLVLQKLVEHKIISQEEFIAADKNPLPVQNAVPLTEPAPYFMDAVNRQLANLEIPLEPGTKVFTTMNMRAQKAAENAVTKGVEGLEKWFRHLQKIKKSGRNLQGILLASDPATARVTALVGGRDFKTAPYNRAVLSHRQAGSIMKPLVYLSALESISPEGKYYTPLDKADDTRFTHSYEGQSWSPKNFDNEYFGVVPLFFALKSSLNAATAKLAISIGVDSVVDISRRLGIKSHIEAFPSLSLGAFELFPIEILQAYTTISRFGEHRQLSFINHVLDFNNQLLFQHEVSSSQVVSKETTAVLVGMMKQTVQNGTGASILRQGFTHPAAGKTGTTNDSKDAWFGGFTPYQVAVAWVGYDDNTSHGLTGATGAIPIWLNFMKEYSSQFPEKDFSWPENTEPYELSVSEQIEMNIPNNPERPLTDIELIFRKGNSPSIF